MSDPADRAERADSPNTSDSGGYESGSGSYQEDPEYPWLSAPEACDSPADDLLPVGELASTVTGIEGLDPAQRDRQVNVRLDPARYATLKAAADVYGTTPTALARMLLNRGATAILNAHRAEMAAFEWADPRG